MLDEIKHHAIKSWGLHDSKSLAQTTRPPWVFTEREREREREREIDDDDDDDDDDDYDDYNLLGFFLSLSTII